MTSVTKNTGVLTTYENPLLSVYTQRCGDSASFKLVEDDFTTFCQENGYDDILRQGDLPQTAARHFDEFLAAGGCHETSLAAQASNISRAVTNSSDSLITRHQAWHDFHDVYYTRLQVLYLLVRYNIFGSRNPQTSHVIAALEMVRESEFFAARFEEEFNDQYIYLNPLFKEILGSQRGMTREIRTLVNSLFPVSRGEDDFPDLSISKELAGPFKAAWQEINDPLRWIEKVYKNIDTLKRIIRNSHSLGSGRTYVFTRGSPAAPGVREEHLTFDAKIGVQTTRTFIRPANPFLARRVLDAIILTTAIVGQGKAPFIKFFWNDEEKALVVYSPLIGKVVKHSYWEEVIASLLKELSLGNETIDLDKMEIHIPIELEPDGRSSSSIPPPGDTFTSSNPQVNSSSQLRSALHIAAPIFRKSAIIRRPPNPLIVRPPVRYNIHSLARTNVLNRGALMAHGL